MPKYNGTGPLGFGPGTGLGLGHCGLGMAWRKGGGRGIGRRFGGFPIYSLQRLTKKEELAALEEEAEILQEELKEIKEQVNELKGQK